MNYYYYASSSPIQDVQVDNTKLSIFEFPAISRIVKIDTIAERARRHKRRKNSNIIPFLCHH